jgi:hypothetical protein
VMLSAMQTILSYNRLIETFFVVIMHLYEQHACQQESEYVEVNT